MKVGDQIHGFTVTSVEELAEQHARIWRMEHEKNKAQLIWMDNKEENRLFSIAFKTVPWDDSGVFHILEHSVLSGSKNYPVKEPFVHLLKSSMNTFLNAMTFPDKTLYPVSSRNAKDFMNLVKVYLDAVFQPSIYDLPNTFYQEGWHYELREGEERPTYKGVVFNEMKGAFASVETQVEMGMNRLLFPQSCYRFVSSGDPEKITDLSYAQFLDAHREYYHPSNARIYLDGDVDLDAVLALLDEEYLCHYEQLEKTHDIAHQPLVGARQLTAPYAIGAQEETSERTQMAFGRIVCDHSQRKKLMALIVLSIYLTGSNESVLKQAILRKGLAQDAYLSIIDGIAQPYCYLRICNTEYERRDAIKQTVKETIEQLIAQGLDTQELDAIINQLEFQLRDGEEPRALGRNIAVLNAWLYDGDPMLYLKDDALFRSLREEMHTGYYEELLREILLDEEHLCELYLLPSHTRTEEVQAQEAARLEQAYASWSEQQLAKIRQLNEELAKWQAQPDSKEALATLPMLSLDEISPKLERVASELHEQNGEKVLFHPVKESGIVHFNLYFSLADLPQEDWSALSFLTNLLGLLPTKRHSAYELQRAIKREIGFLDHHIVAYPQLGDPHAFRPYFTVNVSVLKSRLPQALALIEEILNETLYEGAASEALIEEILTQCHDGMRWDILDNGHRFALQRASSHVSGASRFMEQAEGFAMYQWLDQLRTGGEAAQKAFVRQAQRAHREWLCGERMTLSVTADVLDPSFETLFGALRKGVSFSGEEVSTLPLENTLEKEIIRVPSGVSYAASAGHLARYGQEADGALRVLSTILSYDYLWNEVRVKGGAYGCGCQGGASGKVGFYSYRDPSPYASIDTFGRSAEYVRTFCAGEEAIDKYIISTVAASDPLLSPRSMGRMLDADHFSGISDADRQRIHEEILHSKKADLLKYASSLEAMATDNALCIVGNIDPPKEAEEQWKVWEL